jgi:hypothetical protein
LQAVKLNTLIFSSDIRENSRRFLEEFFEGFTYKVARESLQHSATFIREIGVTAARQDLALKEEFRLLYLLPKFNENKRKR